MIPLSRNRDLALIRLETKLTCFIKEVTEKLGVNSSCFQGNQIFIGTGENIII